MRVRRILLLLLTSVVLINVPGFAASDTVSNPKIAARLVSDTARGQFAEALIVLARQADLSPAASLQSKAAKGSFVVGALRTVAARTQAPILRLLEQRGIPYQSFYIVNMIKITADRELLEELAARPDVAQIDANPQVRSAIPQQTGIDSTNVTPGVEWNVRKVNAPQVWALGFKGQGLVVAGADTGVQWDHPALKNQYRGWTGQTVNHNYNWHDATSQHSRTPIDPHGHGTFTVSEMVGDDGKGNQVGVAPGAKWIGCRNMDANGTGSPATYTECFQFLIAPYPFGHPEKANPKLAPDSINNSWICPVSEGCSANTLLNIVNAVKAAGIFPAMAAGNSGPGCSSVSDPPAIYASSVSVGATDSIDQIASFSSRGPVTADHSNRMKPDVSAPGVNVRGAVPGNGYQSGWSGTSMATPHVAAGVALLWQAKKTLDAKVDATELLMEQTALHLKSTQNCGGSGQNIPNNVYGWGRLDLLKAVQAH